MAAAVDTVAVAGMAAEEAGQGAAEYTAAEVGAARTAAEGEGAEAEAEARVEAGIQAEHIAAAGARIAAAEARSLLAHSSDRIARRPEPEFHIFHKMPLLRTFLSVCPDKSGNKGY